MKKANNFKKDASTVGELRPEYRFDYRKAKSNRFAGQPQEGRVVVVLDPDVSEVFQTPDSVNELLRALIKIMPSRRKRSEPKSRRPQTTP
jgi:hypothetical protein